MNGLYLIGTGGLAREIFGWMKSEASPLLDCFKGFLVTHEIVPDTTLYGYSVKSLNQISEPFKYIASVGDCETRQALVQKLKDKNGTPQSFISKTVHIGENVTIGEGCIVNPRSSISSDVIIGNFVLINCNTGVGHDSIIGHYSSVLGNVAVNGDVTIGDCCLIGSGAVIHPNKKIGDGAIVGMGAMVFKSVRPGITVIGNPARKLG